MSSDSESTESFWSSHQVHVRRARNMSERAEGGTILITEDSPNILKSKLRVI